MTRDFLRRRSPASLVSVDPNIREGIIRSPDTARTELTRVLAHADIVKLSIEDARWLFGDVDAQQAVDAVFGVASAGAGPSLTAVTCGAEGSLLASRTSPV